MQAAFRPKLSAVIRGGYWLRRWGRFIAFLSDPEQLQEAVLPSAQLVCLGDALGSGWHPEKSRVIRRHVLFWLFFLVGGAGGAVAWLGIGGWALLAASIGTALLTSYVWRIERNLWTK